MRQTLVTPNSDPLTEKQAFRPEWLQFVRNLPVFSIGICTFAELPTDPTTPTSRLPRVMIVTDALKQGETTGNGTGTLAYYSNGWFRVSDDSAIGT